MEHVWRWQDARGVPEARWEDTEGWYMCVRCGATDRGAPRAIPTRCPGDCPTRGALPSPRGRG